MENPNCEIHVILRKDGDCFAGAIYQIKDLTMKGIEDTMFLIGVAVRKGFVKAGIVSCPDSVEHEK